MRPSILIYTLPVLVFFWFAYAAWELSMRRIGPWIWERGTVGPWHPPPGGLLSMITVYEGTMKGLCPLLWGMRAVGPWHPLPGQFVCQCTRAVGALAPSTTEICWPMQLSMMGIGPWTWGMRAVGPWHPLPGKFVGQCSSLWWGLVPGLGEWGQLGPGTLYQRE
jgi:hypothetical protein